MVRRGSNIARILVVEETHRNVQTTLVPSGGAALVEFEFPVPGTYILVDHALTRAVDKGALRTIVVEGPGQPELFSKIG